MQHTLAYVVGNDPAQTLALAGYKEAGKDGQAPIWSALRRRARRYLSSPPCIVLRDGITISEDDDGEDVVQAVYSALDENERITVVALHK